MEVKLEDWLKEYHGKSKEQTQSSSFKNGHTYRLPQSKKGKAEWNHQTRLTMGGD